nr:MAG TPA: hypothetical protein [Caudoviricetes sp.]
MSKKRGVPGNRHKKAAPGGAAKEMHGGEQREAVSSWCVWRRK